MPDVYETFLLGFRHFCFGFSYGMGIIIPSFLVLFVVGFARAFFSPPPVVKKDNNETGR